MHKETKKAFLTIATCSKGNISDLLNTCASVKTFTQNLLDFNFEHLLLLSCYQPLELASIQNILDSYSNNVKTRIIEIPPTGISGAFNVALESARGDYITFLNAGDVIKCDLDCISSFNKIIKNTYSEKASLPKSVYYFDVSAIGKSQLFNRRVQAPHKITLYHFLKMGNPINHQSTLYPLNIAQKYPYPKIPVGMDYAINLAMKLNGIEFCKLSGIFVIYNITGISAQRPMKALYENYKTLISETAKFRLFPLIVLCLLLLPLLIIRALIKKLTYSLR